MSLQPTNLAANDKKQLRKPLEPAHGADRMAGMAANDIHNFSSYQIDAMEACFKLCEAVNSGGLTANDLADVMVVAVDEGFDMAMIALTMTAKAMELAGQRKARPREETPEDWADRQW